MYGRRRDEVLYCELCGQPITGRSYTIVLEGTELVVCERCYRRYMEKSKQTQPVFSRYTLTVERVPRDTLVPASRPARQSSPPRRTTTGQPKNTVGGRGTGRTSHAVIERFEVVENYAELIRRARERLGWTRQVLAQKVRESERIIRRIEAGELVPTVDLARRLEKVLGVRLLEPVVEEADQALGRRGKREFYLTLGDIAEVREE